jgi:hypothetical protein
VSELDPELEDLLGPLRDGPIALSSAEQAVARREWLLPAVRAAAAAVPQRLRRARVLRRSAIAGSIGAVAAAALLVFGSDLGLLSSPQQASGESVEVEPLGRESVTWIDANGSRRELAGAAALPTPGEIVNPEASWSRLSTANGVRVEVAPRTRLRVSGEARGSRRPALRLVLGEVHCRVPPLGQREQFSIATPDAQVIVHGTVFSVKVGAPDDPRTCVRVEQGLVEVRHRDGSIRLGPGAQWGCSEPATASARAAASEPRSQRGVRRRAARAQAAAAPALLGDLPDGTLEQENRLLAAALAAERGHDLERARELFTELLATHPDSPLVPEARAGLARTR